MSNYINYTSNKADSRLILFLDNVYNIKIYNKYLWVYFKVLLPIKI